MFKRNENLGNGLTSLCSMEDGVPMDVTLLKGRKGERYTLADEKQEAAYLLLKGKVTYGYNGIVHTFERKDLFHDDAYCLHTCKGIEVTLSFETDGEVLIQKAVNERIFDCKIYDQTNIDKQFFGEGPLASTTKRQVTTILDYERTPYSNMVLGEITNFPGIWSSYPPHYHPQPEVYYYQFDKPQGFGTCFIGDDCYKITDNSVAIIPGGLTHPQNAAPGYAMFYVWMIPHLKGNPWTKTRIFDPDHAWVNDENATFFTLK